MKKANAHQKNQENQVVQEKLGTKAQQETQVRRVRKENRISALFALLVQRVIKETGEILVHVDLKENRVQMETRVLKGPLGKQESLELMVKQERR